MHTWLVASGLNKHQDLVYSPDSQLFAVRYNGKATNKDGPFPLDDTVDSALACSMCRSHTHFFSFASRKSLFSLLL